MLGGRRVRSDSDWVIRFIWEKGEGLVVIIVIITEKFSGLFIVLIPVKILGFLVNIILQTYSYRHKTYQFLPSGQSARFGDEGGRSRELLTGVSQHG